MINNNQIIKSLWIDSTIGVLQRMCYNSYIQNGHIVHLYTYGEIFNLPSGVILKDANEIICESKVFKDSKDSYATFSDWFRIELLFKLGGWWVDSDTICFQRFDLEDEYGFATEIKDIDYTVGICNAFLKLPPRSEIAKSILTTIHNILNLRLPSNIKWTEIGGVLLEHNIIDLNLQDKVLAPKVFCPIHYYDFDLIYKEPEIEFNDDTYALHLWNKMSDWTLINPENTYGYNSLIEILKRKFLY